MAIAPSVKKYLAQQDVDYEVVTHPHTSASMESAEAAHVSGEGLAKAVVLKDDEGYLLAIMPATYKLAPGELHDVLGRRFKMAGEDELGVLFEDCEVGAVPPLANAYGLEAVWDDSLAGMKDVYFEGGDHASLIRVSGEGFRKLMAGAEHGAFSHHV
ncbi:MAG: YbaK/EbsC family protein [Rhodospirillales bacterium]|jgi:Ala-tRNA(Pro) deacylase|nr:YbaK/EbsC family protein [Rhodospirillales bacterium]